MPYQTLVNGTYDPATHEILPGGFPLPDALLQAANVTLSFGDGGCEHVPATEPLKRFFDSHYHYMCFQDLRLPENFFVLCLSGESKRRFYYCTSPPPGTWNLKCGGVDDSTTLCQLFVGPGMNVFLAGQHAQPGLFHRLKTLPHFRDSVVVKFQGNDDRFVYIAFAHDKLVSVHKLLAANVEGDDSDTLKSVLAAKRAPSRFENGADLDLDLDVHICPKMRFTRMVGEDTDTMRLSFADGFGSFASRLPDLPHMAVVAAFKQGERMRAFVYQVDDMSRVRPSPCAEGIFEKDKPGSFSAYQGMAIPLHLLDRVFRLKEFPTCTLEQFRVGALQFACSPNSVLGMMDHGCSLTHYKSSVVVVWNDSSLPPVAPITSDKNIHLRGMKYPRPRPAEGNLLVKHLENYYWGNNDTPLPGAVEMDRGGAEIVAIAANKLWGHKDWPARMTMTASEAGVLAYVEGAVDGKVPAINIKMEPDQKVEAFGQQASRLLWNHEEANTFRLRNDQGGAFGILGQMPGSDLEIAVVMTFFGRGKCVKPRLAYRLRDTSKGFREYERQDLASLPCAILGFHLPKVCLTVFRFLQGGTWDMKWLGNLRDIGTLIERPNRPGIVTRRNPRRVSKRHAVPNDQLEELDAEPLLPETLPLVGFLTKWPFQGANLRHLYDFGATRIHIRERQGYVHALMEHLLGREIQEKAIRNQAALMNCRLLPFLSSSIIESCNDLSEKWREKNAHLRHLHVPSWGDFPMLIKPWDGGAYDDRIDMKEWVVKMPTEEQWQGWTVDQRLELVARLLGFHVFYVNWVRTNGTTPPLSDYHAIIEHISPKLGLLASSKWPVCEDVIKCKRQTRTHIEMNMDVVMFETLVSTIVGKSELVAHVIEQSVVTQHNDLSLHGTIQGMGRSIDNIVKSLSMLYPSYTFFPLLDLRRHLDACRTQLELVQRPVAVAGPTTSGKSTLLSSMVLLKSTDDDADAPDLRRRADDTADFLALYNSMGPDASLANGNDLNRLLINFGNKLESEAAVNDAHNVDVLFGTPAENKSTARVTSAVRLLPQGNKDNTTSHVATVLLNDPSLSKNTVWLHLLSWPEMEKIADISPTYLRWMKDNAELLQNLAGKVLTLPIPGGYNNDVGQRGQTEALLNLIHGVCHKDIDADLGRTYKFKFPGAIRLITLARPMTSILPAYQDFIGFGETDNTLSNPGMAHKMWVVPFTHPTGFFYTALEEALDFSNPLSSRRVVSVFVHTTGANRGKESLKPPNYLAQELSTVDEVVAKVKMNYQCVGNRLQVIGFDAVSAAAMMNYLKRKNCVKVEHLENLPMSIQASGLGEFLDTMHNAYVLSVLDIVEHHAEVRQSLEALKNQWQFGSFPVTDNAFTTALRALPASDMVKAVLVLAFKGKLGNFCSSSLSEEALKLLRSVPQTTKKSVGYLAPFSEQKIMDLLETMEEKSRAIEALGNYFFKATTRNAMDDPFRNLRCVIWVMDQQVEVSEGDVAEYTRVKGECNAVYRELMEGLVYACLENTGTEPYDEIARHLKSVAVEAGVLFLRISCLSLNDIAVDLAVSPPNDTDRDKSMEEALKRQVQIRQVIIGGQQLYGDKLTDHKTVLLEMGKYVMHRVVEQMSISTLKVGSFLEPTKELVAKTLLHFLGCRRNFSETFHKMKGYQDVGQIVALLRRHLVRSFQTYTEDATPLQFQQSDAHPGHFVTGDGAKRTKEREDITSAMLALWSAIHDQLPTFVRETVFSTRPLEHFVAMSRVIMSVDRVGLRRNGHAPFPGFYLGEGEDLDFARWKERLTTIVNSTPLATVDLEDMNPYIQDIRDRFRLHVTFVEGFSTIRKAMAHILGMQCDDLYTKEEFHGRIDQQQGCNDPKVLPFELAFNRAARRSGEAAALDLVYAAYVAKNSLDLGALVKTMGMSIAHLMPIKWAYLFPGDRHMACRYLPTTRSTPLRPQSCIINGLLTPQNELKVPDDLYAHLQKGGMPTLAEVRNRLQTYTSTGEDLFYCIFFELKMVSIKTQRAISVRIYEDDAEGFKVHEHIIRPHLTLQASEESEEKLREADGVYKDIADEKRACHFGTKDTPEELEVIVVYKGQFYVCEGSFVGKVMPLGKHPREEGWTEEKEGGDKKSREEVPSLSPNVDDEDFEDWLAVTFPETSDFGEKPQ